MQVRKNKILEKMRRGQKAYGAAMNFPSTNVVELLGYAGLDFVFFDCEHGSFTTESVEEMCRTADLAGLTPVVRTPSADSATINRWLDRGVMGIMAPHVSTVEEARAVVRAARFGPIGARSWGNARGTHWNYQSADRKPGYQTEVNDNMLVYIQIETVEALENLDALLKVDGIDIYTFGPNDLSQSMGLHGQPGHARVVEAVRRAVEQIHAAGKKTEDDAVIMGLVSNIIVDGAKALLKQK